MDCRHAGSAWLLEISDEKHVTAQRIVTGQYRFFDDSVTVNDRDDIVALEGKYTQKGAEYNVLRLNIAGSLEQDERQTLQTTLDRIGQTVLHLEYNDSGLRTRVTSALIEREFSTGSFPQLFLGALQEQGDEQALQMAYELVQEVKKT